MLHNTTVAYSLTAASELDISKTTRSEMIEAYNLILPRDTTTSKPSRRVYRILYRHGIMRVLTMNAGTYNDLRTGVAQHIGL